MALFFSDYHKRIKSFSRNAKLFLLAIFLFSLNMSMNGVIYNIFLLRLDYTEDFLGTLILVTSVATVIFAIPAGRFSDRYGHKNGLVLALGLGTIGAFGKVIFPYYTALLLFSVVGGIASALAAVAFAPFLADNSKEEERDYLFSVEQAATMLSGAFGGILAGLMPRGISLTMGHNPDSASAYQWTLIFAGIFLIAAMVPMLMATPTPKQKSSTENPTDTIEKKGFLGLSEPMLLLKLLTPSLIISMGAGLVIPFMSIFLDQYVGATSGQIGFIFSWSAIFTALAMLLAPVLAAKYGRIRTIVWAQLLSVPFMLMIVWSGNIWFVAVSMWIRQGLMNMSGPLTQAFAMHVIPEKERATASGILNISWQLGFAVSAQLGGWLMANVSYTLPYYITATMYAGASLLYYYFFRGFDPVLEPEQTLKSKVKAMFSKAN